MTNGWSKGGINVMFFSLESAIALAFASSKLAPCNNTSPPKPRTASTLILGVFCGITIRAFKPSCFADNATPCAWLPAEAAITPAAFCSADRLEIMAYAPRSLKLLTGWRSSRLIQIALCRRSDNLFIFCNGVTCAAS